MVAYNVDERAAWQAWRYCVRCMGRTEHSQSEDGKWHCAHESARPRQAVTARLPNSNIYEESASAKVESATR